MRRVQVDAGACVLWALAVLLVPFRWLISALTAALVHEACHLLAVRLTGGQVLCVNIGFRGTCIRTGPMSGLQESICALAGPAGSLMLAICLRRFPLLAFCGMVQGCFNLLPVYPMDGGRVLLALLKRFLPESCGWKAEQWLAGVSIFLLCLLCILCVMVTDYVVLPIFAVISVVYRVLAGTKPCKAKHSAVQ